MKFLKVFFVGLVVLIIVAGIGLFIFLKTFDINRFLPQITSQVSQQIGKAVTVGRTDLVLSIANGISLHAREIVLHQDASPMSEKIFEAPTVKMALDVMTFLKSREIRIVGIQVVNPRLKLVRDKAGNLNILPAAASAGSPAATTAATGKSATPANASLASLPAVRADRMSIEGAEVSYADFALTPPVSVQVSKIDVVVNNFSLSDPFNFEIKAAVLAGQQNFQVAGKMKLALATVEAVISDLNVRVDLNAVDLVQLKKVVPSLEGILGNTLAGQVKINGREIVAGAQGLVRMAVTGSLEGGEIALIQPNLTINLKPLTADFEVNEKDAVLKSFLVGVAGGEVKGQGRLDDYLKRQAYTADIVIKDFSPAPFVPDLGGGAKFEGSVNGQFKVKGSGFDPNLMLKNLVSDGGISVDKARLVNFNVLKIVLEKISMIPNLSEKVITSLPEEYRKQLDRQETVFQKIVIQTQLKESVVHIDKAEVISDVFSVNAKGSCDLAQNVSLNADFHIPAALSKAMVAGVKELSSLQDDTGSIMIPLTPYNGPMAKAKIYPDIKYLGKKIIVNRGAQELEKLLNKAIGSNEDQPVPAGQEGEPGTEGQVNPRATAVKGLETIFNKALGNNEEQPTDQAAPVSGTQVQGQPSPTAEPKPAKKAIEGLFNTILEGK